MKSLLLISLSLGLFACAPTTGPSINATMPVSARGGLSFLPERAEKGALFRYYQPKAESKWLGNWASGLDLTGVSWNDARTATLVSRSHVVMAGHFTRPGSVPAMFHDKSGKPHERYITAVKQLPGDISVGRLNLPLPAGVRHYRFASAADATAGRPVIVTDQTKTLSVHRVDQVIGSSIRLAYMPELDPVYRRNLVVGDSGNPSFLLKNGELLLLETHTTGGPGAGPFYGAPEVQQAVRAAILELGG